MRLLFTDLEAQAKKLGYYLERSGNRQYPYDLWSQEHEPGVTTSCENLMEVWSELRAISIRFYQSC